MKLKESEQIAMEPEGDINIKVGILETIRKNLWKVRKSQRFVEELRPSQL